MSDVSKKEAKKEVKKTELTDDELDIVSGGDSYDPWGRTPITVEIHP